MGKIRGTTKYKVQLKPEERDVFLANLKKGVHSARVLRREKILLMADKGNSPPEIAKEVNVSLITVYNTLRRYAETGDANLADLPRSGRPEKVSGNVKAHIVATACTDAPAGRCRWTLRLLADQVVQLELIESISTNTIGRILKKTN